VNPESEEIVGVNLWLLKNEKVDNEIRKMRVFVGKCNKKKKTKRNNEQEDGGGDGLGNGNGTC
jgi:hypothetical protein